MSYTDHVRPLALNGLPVSEISTQTGICREKVRRIVSRMRERGEPVPRERSLRSRAAESSRKAAAKRGITVRSLWTKVQSVIATDDLFDAILDDVEDSQ